MSETVMPESSERMWPLWRVGLWAAILVLLGALLGGAVIDALRPPADMIYDFFQEYASARNLVEGDLPVYANQDESLPRYVQDEQGRPLVRSEDEMLWLAYNAHPPTAVLLAVPLAGLSYQNAFLVWNLLSLAALAATIAIVIHALGRPVTPWIALPIVALLMLCKPLMSHLIFGQLSLLVALLVTAAWALGRSGRSWAAGATLGLAVVLKIFPAFMFLYFLVRRDWKALAGGAAMAAGATLLTLGVMGPEPYRDYLAKGLPQTEEFRSGWGNISAYGFFCKLFDPAEGSLAERSDVPAAETVERGGGTGRIVPLVKSPWLAKAGAAAVALAVLGLLVWLTYCARDQESRDWAYALTAVGMLICSPIAWNHYLLILVLPAALFVRRLPLRYVPEAALCAMLVALFYAGLAPVVPMVALVLPILVLLTIPLALAATWSLDRAPQRLLVFAVLLAAVFLPDELLFNNFVAGGVRDGVAGPLAVVTVLSIHFYALLGLLAFGTVLMLAADRAADCRAAALAQTVEEAGEDDEEAWSTKQLAANESVRGSVAAAETRIAEVEKPSAVEMAPAIRKEQPATTPVPVVSPAALESDQELDTKTPIAASAPAVAPSPRPFRGQRSVTAFLIAQAVVLLAVVAYGAQRYYHLDQERRLPDVDLFRKPLEVSPLYDWPEMVSDEDLSKILRRLPLKSRPGQTRVYDIEHSLRLWGVNQQFGPEYLSGNQMLEILTSYPHFAAFYGRRAKPLLVDTPDGGVGVEVAKDPITSSSHVDHTLACMAEVGVPLHRRVSTVGQPSTSLHAVFQQMMRNFKLNQSEYEWSSLCFALYLPPEIREFTSTEGQRITFDLLAGRLMRQETPQGVCSAQHRMHTLTVFLRVDEQLRQTGEPALLSPETRQEVVMYLAGISRQLVETQHHEGYWDGLWTGEIDGGQAAPNPSLKSLQNRLLVTGHVLEWWALAPKECLPPRETILRAGIWLSQAMLDLSDRQVDEYYSFLTHGGRALALWRGRLPHQVDLTLGLPPAEPSEAGSVQERPTEALPPQPIRPSAPAESPRPRDEAPAEPSPGQ